MPYVIIDIDPSFTYFSFSGPEELVRTLNKDTPMAYPHYQKKFLSTVIADIKPSDAKVAVVLPPEAKGAVYGSFAQTQISFREFLDQLETLGWCVHSIAKTQATSTFLLQRCTTPAVKADS